ncbi:chemotaxis protein CheB [Streptomyces sp. NPDC059785]|uniref:chemotaxis protein CheB n=1 Tax=unclassified Streptomyces TaxID=2593676 RepID=UPI00366415AC
MDTGSDRDRPDRRTTVVVGSSAGGLAGLGVLLNGLGAGPPVVVLVAQHLQRTRQTLIADILTRRTGRTVKLAEHGERPLVGVVYIAPPNRHLCVNGDGTLKLSDEAPVNFSRPAADPLFESAARAYGSRLIGCVLTGADSDGARGVEAVKAHGGVVIVQDPSTAQFAGMPKAAVETGRADLILHLADIAPAINRIVTSSAYP